MNKFGELLAHCSNAYDYCCNEMEALLALEPQVGLLKLKPENLPLHIANIFDTVDLKEIQTSRILCAIFAYKRNGKHVILESFVERFFSHLGLSASNVHSPIITAEEERIDLLIRERNYAIIFENKLKGAAFQPNQLARYIKKQLDEGKRENDIFVVILPKVLTDNYIEKLPLSVWRLPFQGQECICQCDEREKGIELCEGCKDFRPIYKGRTIVLEDDFAQWLLKEVPSLVEPRETFLRLLVSHFAEYIKGLYKRRINNNLLMDITKYLKKELLIADNSAVENYKLIKEKIENLGDLLKGMEELKAQLSKSVIDQWYEELRQSWNELRNEPNKSFGINIRGVWCGCWSGDMGGLGKYANGNTPFWGFIIDEKATITKEEARKMVKQILDGCGVTHYHETPNWIAYCSTENGASRCAKFYDYAKKHNLL